MCLLDVFCVRRGRSPDRPAGYDTGAVRKDVHGYTVGSRADVGIGPYGKTVRFPTVGDDPQIVPPGTTPERPEKTYAAIPSAPGPMWAIVPYRKTVRFPTVGDDPQIVPLGTIPERPEKTCAAIPSAPGPMWASAPTEKRFVSPLWGTIPRSSRWVRHRSGQKRRARLYRRPPGRCGHRPLRKNGSFPHCRGRSPDRPAGYDVSVVRKERPRPYPEFPITIPHNAPARKRAHEFGQRQPFDS